MARPTKPESEKRTATLRVRLTPAELEAAVKLATEAGQEFADWVRGRLRKGPGRPRKAASAPREVHLKARKVGATAAIVGNVNTGEPGHEAAKQRIVEEIEGAAGSHPPPEPSRDPETPDLMTNLEKSLEPARARRTTPGDVDAERTAVEIEEARLADNAAHEAFVERRTRELHGQGKTTPVARRLAEAEWRNRGG